MAVDNWKQIAVDALRNNKLPVCKHTLYNGGAYCAMGLVGLALGAKFKAGAGCLNGDECNRVIQGTPLAEPVSALIALDGRLYASASYYIKSMFDSGRMSLNDVADFIEKL